MYRSVRNQDEAELILVEQLGRHAEDNANGIVIDDTVILPDISLVKEAPEGKKLARVGGKIYMELQNLRAMYDMVVAIKDGKREVSRYCQQCVEGSFIKQFMELDLNYVAPVAILLKKGANPADIKPVYLNRAENVRKVLDKMQWVPRKRGDMWFVAKRN
jgi:hypothetical protein